MKNRHSLFILTYRSILILMGLCMLFLMSCGGKTTQTLPGKITKKNTDPVIIFMSGEVRIKQGGQWKEPETGEKLNEGDSVKTDTESYCELQFGNISTVIIEEETILIINKGNTISGEPGIFTELEEGSLLGKVIKLTDDERFEVKTEVANMSVRGTEFRIQYSKNHKTMVSVKSGAVAVFPLPPGWTEFENKTPGSNVFIREIELLAPVIKAGEEFIVDRVAAEKTGDIIKKLKEDIMRINQEPDKYDKFKELAVQTSGEIKTILPAIAPLPPVRKVLFEKFTTPTGEKKPEAADPTPAPQDSPVPSAPGFSPGTGESPSPTADPVMKVLKLSVEPLAGAVTASGESVYIADSQGMVSAFTTGGTLQWQTETNNRLNELSYPVLIENFLFFSGSMEQVVLDTRSGDILSRQSLNAEESHLYGQRAVPFKENLAFLPTGYSVRIIELPGGVPVDEREIPGGLQMTPLYFDTSLYVISREGTVYILDPENMQTQPGTIKTEAEDPLGLRMVPYDGKFFFAGRNGTVVSIDIASRQILWQTRLEPDRSIAVNHDLSCGPGSIYVYGNNTIYRLDPGSGEQLSAPINDVTAPPLYTNEKLYFGTGDGKLNMLNAGTGELLKDMVLDYPVTAKPAFSAGKLLLGTLNGEAVILDERGLSG